MLTWLVLSQLVFAQPKKKKNLDVPPPPTAEGQAFCAAVTTCLKKQPTKTALCVKTSLKDVGVLAKPLGGDSAKDLPRFLRAEGFTDREMMIIGFRQLPEGSILVLDAHDPLKDKKPACPKVYGNVLVKCGEFWIDDEQNALDFHMKRGCRTKGIWVHPKFVAPTAEDATETQASE